MKKLLLIPLLALMLPTMAQLQTEQRVVIEAFNPGEAEAIIRSGSSYSAEVTLLPSDIPLRRTLRVVGGCILPGKFSPRGEEFFRQQEYLIDDNLDNQNRKLDSNSLYFNGNNDPFERHAYNRITGVDFSSGKIDIEVLHKRNNLKISSGGDFGIELQIYLKNERRHPDDIYDRADTIIFIPIPQGSGGFKTLRKSIAIPTNSATILLRTGGTHFSGECWMEAPRIYIDGKTVFNSPFVENEKRANDYNYWVGINMSTRSWPLWKLEWNEKTVFQGHIFDRASDVADFFIPLPDNISGTGTLKLSLLQESHRKSYDYELKWIELQEEPKRAFEIVSAPKYLSVGDTSAILVEINKKGTSLRMKSSKTDIQIINSELQAEKPGLYTLQIAGLHPSQNSTITLSDGQDSRNVTIDQIIIKERDNVYLSSGDEIYIDKEYGDYDRFFKWYVSQRMGNWYHFRPSYQWSGVRITKPDVMKHYFNLLNALKMPYAWQVEGRTHAGMHINPSTKVMESPMFRGRQAHENDGGYYYWQHFLYNGLQADMAARTRPYGGIFAKHRPIRTDHGTFIHYDLYGVKDMADGAQKLIANLSYSRGESTRHTGPSTMFRYFYQAGYQWLGAEQMYGPEDIILSSLRGASRAYCKNNFGSLHAVQWGSQPFTDPVHSLRFYLSLATAYMHGSSHINTEEGLWTDEYANDRYSKSGKEHIYAQHQMLDYIETHTRKGRLYAPIAVLQGRNDAWKSFGRTEIWSQKGDKWAFNKAMESFDLLKVFYPENNVDYCSTEGLFTSTPYGPADILPIEAPQKVINQYRALIFLGWNSFDNTDFIRLREYVNQGGTLLLTAAHLNSNLQPDEEAQFPEDDTVIQSLLGLDYKKFTQRTVIRKGLGKIIYYPQNIYPSQEQIREAYTNDIHTLAKDEVHRELKSCWVESSPKINFSVWDSEQMRTIYLLNTDWQSGDSLRKASLVVNGKLFSITVSHYTIATVRYHDGLAAMAESNTSDILKIEKRGNGWRVTCQTTGADRLILYNGVTGTSLTKTIPKPGIHTFDID